MVEITKKHHLSRVIIPVTLAHHTLQVEALVKLANAHEIIAASLEAKPGSPAAANTLSH